MVDYLYKGPAMCDSDDFLALVCTSCKKLLSFILMINIAYTIKKFTLWNSNLAFTNTPGGDNVTSKAMQSQPGANYM